ncbi:MAG: SH3 domain-containing protein, partial [Anaerolineae bacterium]|nr:SH3 domain-containing protein [Anaerolineae bacterium]
MRNSLWLLIGLLAACSGAGAEVNSIPATATLAPIVSMTPRFTATPLSTRTPLPTFTFTPSQSPIPPTPSDTPTPTEIPPIIGIIASINTVNVREGPGTGFSAFEALRPGTRVEVLGQDVEGVWLNIRLEDGREGWVATSLVRLQDTPTPLPTLTP